jgi:hypothetical protein
MNQLRLDGSIDIYDGEHYPTPAWLVGGLLSKLHAPAGSSYGSGLSVLDPGAGDGRLGRAARTWLRGRGSVLEPHVTFVESSPARASSIRRLPWNSVYESDYVQWASDAAESSLDYSLIVCNPPFTMWMEFVRASLPLLHPYGTMAMLGFSNILATPDRADFFRRHRPSHIYQSPRRPRFIEGKSSGDPRDSVWVVWSGSAATTTETHFDWLEV